jgi:hypothetical protein
MANVSVVIMYLMFDVYAQLEHFQFHSTLLDYVKHFFPVGAPIRKSHYNTTYHHLYIALGRPHRKPLSTQPYPHNGMF